MKPNADTNLESPLCECANCGLRTKADDLDPTHDIWSRIQPGEILPHGDCPECGAFCYPVNRPEIRLFKIEPGVIPPDPDDQNDDRAAWAGQCIELFQKLTRCDEEDAVHDLITDLAHYCDRRGSVDFNDELNHAAKIYNEETQA